MTALDAKPCSRQAANQGQHGQHCARRKPRVSIHELHEMFSSGDERGLERVVRLP